MEDESEGLDDLIRSYLACSRFTIDQTHEESSEDNGGESAAEMLHPVQPVSMKGLTKWRKGHQGRRQRLTEDNEGKVEAPTKSEEDTHEMECSKEASGDADEALSDEWIRQMISTEAKPRKKPVRRKQKWRRQKNIQEPQQPKELDITLIDTTIDIQDIHTTVPYHTKRLVPPLTQLCIAELKRHWSHPLRSLPHQVHSKLAGDILQNAMLVSLKTFHEHMESQVKSDSDAIKRRTLHIPFHSYDWRQLNLYQEHWCLANFPATQVPAYYVMRPEPFRIDIGPYLHFQPQNLYYTSFAAYLNLLLPSFLSKKSQPTKFIKGKDFEEKVVSTAIRALHQYLTKELPCHTERYFDFSLPYVWWARGNKLQAEKYFKSAIAKSSNQMTGLLYNELGRLYTHFGDRHLVPTCFITALDFAKCQVTREDQIPQLDLAQAVLMASTLDQGFLNARTALEASVLWERTFDKLPGDQAKHLATASLMCFHFTHSPIANVDWWKAFDTVLRRRSAFTALSLLKSMCGTNEASQSDLEEYSTPWFPIALGVQDLRRPLHPIPMLWRRVLTQPVVELRKPIPLFDISHDDTSLWMTHDEYLTGDFQLLLPPMPQVKLDPYTGDVVHSLSLTTPGPWKGNCLPTLDFKQLDSYHLPSQLRVYEDGEGTSVDLYIINHPAKPQHMETSKIILKWKSKGVESTLDLKKDMRKFMRKHLEHPQHLEKFADSEANKAAYLKFVDECYKNGLALSPEQVDTGYNNIININQEIDQLESKIALQTKAGPKLHRYLKKEIEKAKHRKKFSVPKFFITVQSYTSYGKALVISFGTTTERLRDSFFYVFNCDNENSFRDFKAHILSPEEQEERNWEPRFDLNTGFSKIVTSPTGQALSYPEASIVVLPKRLHIHNQCYAWSSFNVFSETGEKLTTVLECSRCLDYTAKKYRELICVIGYKLFGVHPMGQKIISHDVIQEECRMSRPLPTVISASMLGRFILVCTVGGIYILNEDLETLHWNTEDIKHSMEVADNSTRIQGQFSKVALLTCNEVGSDCNTKVWRVLLAADDTVLLLHLFGGRTCFDSLVCNTVVQVPGTPTEACYVHETIGFLIVSSVYDESEQYHEELYQFNIQGEMLAILPYLGKGPHQFLPVLLPGSEDAATEKDDPTLAHPNWYIFCFDGYGAVCCIRPHVDD